MCRSQAEGGQRCASHAREAMQKAAQRYHDTVKERDQAEAAGQRVRANALNYEVGECYRDYTDACANYASTPKGEADFRARLAASGSFGAMYRRVIEEGLLRRERNEAIRQAALKHAASDGSAAAPTPSAAPTDADEGLAATGGRYFATDAEFNAFYGIQRTSPARRLRGGGCGCACSSGGSCGGCGHAGCGGR